MTEIMPYSGDAQDESDSRIEAEVKAAVVLARRFPRDETDSMARIDRACQRASLAETAIYTYPRGGTQIEGPSIRLAETIAQSWGNIHFGVKEVGREKGQSIVMTYAWDLETNVRHEKTFTVKHEREAKGKVKKLTDPRDIYEMTANQGARRLRACILAIIPGDVTERGLDRCKRTLTEGHDKPVADRIGEMVIAFKNEYGVTKAQIEKRLGHRIGVTSESELITMKGIFRSLKDGMSSVLDHFDEEPPEVVDGKKKDLPPAIGEPEGQSPSTEVVQRKSSDPPPKPHFAIDPGDGCAILKANVETDMELLRWEMRFKADGERWSKWETVDCLPLHEVGKMVIGNLTNGVMYTVEVRAVGEGGPSEPSDQRTCQPAPITE